MIEATRNALAPPAWSPSRTGLDAIGEFMRTFCTYCGAANAAESAACYACGTPLESAAPPAVATPTVHLGVQPPAPGPFPGADGQLGVPSAVPLPPSVLGQPWQPPQPLPPYTYPGMGHFPYVLNGNGYPPPPQAGQPAVAPWPPPPGYSQQAGYGPPPYGYPYGPSPYQGANGGQPHDAGFPQIPGYAPGYPPSPYLPVPAYCALPVQYGQGALAGAGPRFGAYLLDSIVVGVPMFMLLTVAGATDSVGLAMLWLLLAVFGPALYFILSWATSGRTVGYRAMGLQLVRTDGTQPGPGAAIARYLGVFLCNLFFIPGILGMLWMLWDDKRQGWHDKMADTLVIKS